MNCLQCHHPLSPPDATHRYCPYCGSTRVVNDAGSDTDKMGLVVGVESIGPNSGMVYATQRLANTPTKVDPLKGPHLAPDSTPWPELFASSGTPNPETTLLRYAQPLLTKDGPPEKALNVGFWRITHRHRRLFVLTVGGQLWALNDDTLDYFPLWEHSRVEGATVATRLTVTDTLLLATTQNQNDCRIQGFDVGRGRQLFTLHLPLSRSSVSVAGGHLLIVGVNATGSPSAARYPLEALAGSSQPQAQMGRLLASQGQQPAVDACAFAVDGGHVFLLPDGKVYGWSTDRPNCDMLWPNPTLETRVPEQGLLGFRSGAMGVLTTSDGSYWLRTYGLSADRRIEMISSHELTHLRDSRNRFVATCNDQLYVLSHPPGLPLSIMVSDCTSPSDSRPFFTLSASADTEVTHFSTIAWSGRPRLLLRTAQSGRHAQEFWLIDPVSAAHEQVLGARARTEILEGVWGAGQFWLADMTKGRIECAGR